MVLVELFSIAIIGGTIFLTLFMLPVYFIRKKKNPNDSKNVRWHIVGGANRALF